MTETMSQLDLFAARVARREEAKRESRSQLLELLSDLEWHERQELARVGNRYGARVGELRDEGYEVVTEEADIGRRYRLVSLTKGAPRERRVKPFLAEADADAITRGFVPDRARAAVREALALFRANRGKR